MSSSIIRTACFSLILILLFLQQTSYSQERKSKKEASDESFVESININVGNELRSFDADLPGAEYSISLCADVPNNKKPYKVAHHQQTGHVFLILQKMNTTDTISQVFGFYPKNGLPTLIFKTTRSVIKDNSMREHDVSISKKLTRSEFDTVISRAIALARHIYHINKYNCYEYAVYVFNSVAGADSVPVTHVRFPFIFGKGGSPVSLYKDLEKMKASGSSWADAIQFGEFIAPKSTTRVIPSKDEKKKSKK